MRRKALIPGDGRDLAILQSGNQSATSRSAGPNFAVTGAKARRGSKKKKVINPEVSSDESSSEDFVHCSAEKIEEKRAGKSSCSSIDSSQ